MAETKVRMQRLRARREARGDKAAMIWFTAAGYARLNRLRRPGENMSQVVDRALEELEGLDHRSYSVTTDVSTNVTTDDLTPPDLSRDDAPLLALLRQETPRLTYLQISMQLGMPEGTVKRKAAQWTREGRLAPRPRGGARPRRNTR
jgi:hypothetical protein